MSQHALPDLLLDDPNGLELAELLNNWNAALMSAHSGATRPAYAVKGTIWLRENGSGETVMFYDGAADRELMRADQLTAAGVLALLLTVDGAGSGLDADKLDGNQAAVFMKSSDNLSTLPNAATARQNLGLGSMATQDAVNYDQAIAAKAPLAGATFTGDVQAPNFASTSDARLKSNIEQIGSALALIKSLNGVRYVMGGKQQVGVVAQDVEQHVPEVVSQGSDGYLRVAYGPLVAPLIEAVKELAAKVEALEGARDDA